MSPAKTARKQGGQFAKGKSGNPNGRPKGSRNAATLALESLLDGQAEALTQKAIKLALGGNLMALRICMDRILPPRKDRPVAFEIPAITGIEDRSLAYTIRHSHAWPACRGHSLRPQTGAV